MWTIASLTFLAVFIAAADPVRQPLLQTYTANVSFHNNSGVVGNGNFYIIREKQLFRQDLFFKGYDPQWSISNFFTKEIYWLTAGNDGKVHCKFSHATYNPFSDDPLEKAVYQGVRTSNGHIVFHWSKTDNETTLEYDQDAFTGLPVSSTVATAKNVIRYVWDEIVTGPPDAKYFTVPEEIKQTCVRYHYRHNEPMFYFV